MFTAIGNIIGQQPRHAESSDTRQDIQRHDPDHERRRRKKQFSEEDLLGDTDGATIAVEALNIFLENFLKTLGEQSKQQFQKHAHNPEAKISENTNPQPRKSGQAAYAANAYQSMADTQKKTSLLEDIPVEDAPTIALEAGEVRKIHALLEDLKILRKKNIEYIRIERSESFLQSLTNAVQKAITT